MRKIVLIALLSLPLASCGGWVPQAVEAFGTASTTTVDTKTLKQSAFTAYGIYTQAVEGAAAYAKLPRCTVMRPMPCSKQSVVDEMRRLDNEAYPYVNRAATLAREVAPSVTVLQAAVQAAQAAAGNFNSYVIANKGI